MKRKNVTRLLSVMLTMACIVNVSAVNTALFTVNAVEASNAEPVKNEYQILSPVPSGTSISPITQLR